MILRKGWLSELQLEEIRRDIEGGKNIVDMSEESDINPTETESYDNANQFHQERGNVRKEVGNGENKEFIVNYNRMDYGEKRYILEKVIDLMNENDLKNPQNLRTVDRLKVKDKTKPVNEVIALIETHDITETNKLIKCGTLVLTQLLGVKEIKKNILERENLRKNQGTLQRCWLDRKMARGKP